MMNCKNLVALKGIAKVGKKVLLLFERNIDFIYRFWNIKIHVAFPIIIDF